MLTHTSLKQMYVAALGLLLIAASCKKDNITQPAPVPTPAPIKQEISIAFLAETMPLQQFDSAFIIVRDTAQHIKKWERMNNLIASLYTSLADLQAGTYTAEVTVQTKREQDNTAKQYVAQTTFTLPLSAKLQLIAPKGNFENNWYKRVVLYAPANEAIVVVAMDPRDAFYGISMKEAQWDYSKLQRHLLYDRALIATKEHTRNLQDLIGFSDYHSFVPYTQALQGKLWSKGIINVYLKHRNGREVDLEYEYNK